MAALIFPCRNLIYEYNKLSITNGFHSLSFLAPASMTQTADITLLLQAWQAGDTKAQDELFQIVYAELRRIAQRRLRGENRAHTLQATEVVHEVFPQLAKQRQPWQNRSHFYALASECMRRYLVDYARTRGRQKRGGDFFQVSISDLKQTEICRIENFDEVLAVDKALQKLAQLDETQALIIKHRYFGGLAREEIAQILEVSPATVDRAYRLAKAWLKRELVFEFSPYLLRISQIKSPTTFLALIQQGGNIYADSLRAQLPNEIYDQLAQHGISRLPSVLEIVNKIMLGKLLFPATIIENLLPYDKAAVPAKENLPVEEIVRLNRRLFEAAFPAIIEKIF